MQRASLLMYSAVSPSPGGSWRHLHLSGDPLLEYSLMLRHTKILARAWCFVFGLPFRLHFTNRTLSGVGRFLLQALSLVVRKQLLVQCVPSFSCFILFFLVVLVLCQ